MKRFIYILLLGMLAMTQANAAVSGDWKLYPTHPYDVFKVIETPARVYLLGHSQYYSSSIAQYSSPDFFIHYYDKEAEEMVSMDARGALSENVGIAAEYNARKRYLLVIYSNYNIDLIYDDGKVVNIPGYMTAGIAASKDVNDITFDAIHNRAYLATSWGYVEINDEKGEISTSRVYNSELKSVGRCGENLIVIAGNTLYAAPAAEANFALDDFRKIGSGGEMIHVFPLSDTKFAVQLKEGGDLPVDVYTLSGKLAYTKERLSHIANQSYKTENSTGFLLGHNTGAIALKRDGSSTYVGVDSDNYRKLKGSWDMTRFWLSDANSGLYCWNKDGSTAKPSAASPVHPNSPLPYICTDMVYHPRAGMLAVNHGYTLDFSYTSAGMKTMLSGVKNGLWTHYSPSFTNPEQTSVLLDPNGLAIDPDNDKYIYICSLLYGMIRLNLDDPKDILHLSRSNDPSSNLPGFVNVAPPVAIWSALCKFSPVAFDASGTMWTAYNNADQKEHAELLYWTADKRRASTSASTYRPMGRINIDGTAGGNTEFVQPLKTAHNKNIVIYCRGSYGAPLVLLDHKGTLEDTGDDDVVFMDNLYDQDGGVVDPSYIRYVYEDPRTGLVWVCSSMGVFHFDPRQAMASSNGVTRPKVSRDDGSGYADYLLNGVEVTRMDIDSSGRKWFSTKGAGLVCTSSDGRMIMGEYTTDNSWLPDNNVMGMACNPANNSVMVSTMQGLAELFPGGSVAADNLDSVRCYPNPVRPDYYGWVTIDGLIDNALVKIVDAGGNLVKELGMAEGGRVQWDATGMSHKRVATGVYYVVASSGPNDGNMAKVSKVLVMN